MRNIWTIAKREYDHYFSSPLAYAVGFTILLVVGLIFALNILSYAQNPYQYYGSTPDATLVTGPFAFMMLLTVPALTMRLISDEQRMGTMELLLTAPVRDSELIIGKWLGAFLFMLTLIGLSLVFPLILNNLVDPHIDQKLMLSAYLGVILVAAAYLALGVGISALFSNQVTAFFVTLATFVFLWWLIDFPAQVLPLGGGVFNYLSMQTHFTYSLNRGIIQVSDLVYFGSLIALGLFTGTTAVEIRRWR